MGINYKIMTILEKITGGLIGFAIGDAIGAQYEFKQPPVLFDLQYADLPSKGLKAGQGTDDTEHLLLSLDSLLQNKGSINLEDLAERLKLWEKTAKSLGYTTRRAISNLRRGIPPEESGIREERASGALGTVRLIPFSLFDTMIPHKEKKPYQEMKKVVEITHASTSVNQIGRAIDYFTHEVTHGHTPLETVNMIIGENEFLNKRFRKNLTKVLNLSLEPENRIQTIGSTGYIKDIFFSAIYANLKATNFYEVLKLSLEGGGDTDTRTAYAGFIAGLSKGYNSIPPHLIEGLKCAEEIRDKTKQLYNLARRNSN